MKHWDLPRWLLFLICFGVLPHVVRIPIWNSALSSGFLLWYYLHILGYVKKPNRALRAMFAFLCLGGILLTYRTILGLDAGLAFIVQISCLKLFEVEKMRDSILIVWLSSLLVIAEILYEQNLLVTAWFILGLAFIAKVMGKIYQWERAPASEKEQPGHWSFSWRVAFPVISIALVLFFVFPRVNFSLWSGFSEGTSGQIGFSEELRPGDIAQIAASNQVAFRARILEGDTPNPSERYWRGLVLSVTDGRVWMHTRKAVMPQADRLPAVAEEEKPNYVLHEITLEPHRRKWLFAMDEPSWVELRGGFKTKFRRYRAGEYYTNRTVQGRMNYLVLSKLKKKQPANPPRLSASQRKRELQMPRNFESPLKDLAAELQLVAKNDEDYVQRVLNYFRDNEFIYTLSPGILKSGKISEFVFETKKGFCEHFASATALILRLGGVPARVVVGFHGGKANPYGNYLIVEYRDAHSWVEAWIKGKGWVRVDPTAIVAPGRLTLGGQDFVDRFGIDPELARSLAQMPKEDWTLQRLLTEIIFLWDLANDSWNNALISYDQDMQRAVLSRISWRYPIWVRLFGLLTAGFVLIGILLFLYYHFRRQPADEVSAIYQRIIQSLSRRGLKRNFAEGPVDLMVRAQASKNGRISIQHLQAVIDDYIDLRFGKKALTAENLREFRRKAQILE